MIAAFFALAIAAPPSSFALIVTNNRSLELERPDLRYADDDGVKYAQLFDEAFGASRVELLTELDAETRALYPDFAVRARPPTRAELDRAVERLSRSLRKQPGASLYLVLAGHGDVYGGEGYIELADQRLSASELEAMIGSLPATRVHLLLDSCNSYFMLSPRKPGGRRWTVSPDPRGLLERHPHVGAVISTSAEAVTYEWSELQAGIFSYEVRSGLRGAADADADGTVTYEELAAFLEVSNRAIANDLYRPKVLARAPADGTSTALFAYAREASRELLLPAAGARRVTIRDRVGVRVLDVHKEDGTQALLRLPGGTELAVYELVSGADRPERTLRTFTATVGRAWLDDLPISAPAIAERGDAPVFRSIFAEPFGERALARHREAPTAIAEVYGVSRRDAERLGAYLRTTASYERESRTFAGLGFLAMAAGVGTGGGVLARHEGRLTLESGLLVGAAGGLAIAGTLALLLESDSETLLQEFGSHDPSNEAERSQAVVDAEARLGEIAEDYARTRMINGITALVVGAGAFGITGVRMASAGRGLEAPDAITLGVGSLMILVGIYELALHRHPAEHTYELYTQEVESERGAPTIRSLLPSVTVSADAVGLSLGGRF